MSRISQDRENSEAEALLGILEAERAGCPPGVDPIAWAVVRGWDRMRRQMVSEMRDRRRRRTYAEWVATFTPEETMDTSDVPDLLGRLSDRERRAIELRFWHGLDGDAMAKALGCSAIRARGIANSALKRLREIYL